MQIANSPLKWTIPFANGDAGRVEVPATSVDPTKASLTLGFPPLTRTPPESGGVPPHGEDFNGAMNQVARIAWWQMGGGRFNYDATFATDSNVNGYPQGGVLDSSDHTGSWLSLIDNNTANPDTTGIGWAPLSTYGVTALTGQTGGTTTLTPGQAMKRTITIAGTLTSNLVVVLPAWTYNWQIANLTTGAFSVTVKTAAGSGTIIPQTGTPTPVVGDGTNIGSADYLRNDLGNSSVGKGSDLVAFGTPPVANTKLSVLAPSGSTIGNFTYGSAGAPLPVDPAFGYAGLNVAIYGDPGTGTADPFDVAIQGTANLSAGSRGLAVGVYGKGSVSGTWTSSAAAGAIGVQGDCTSSRGGSLFAGAFDASADTTAGANIRGVEIDVHATTSVATKFGLIIVSPENDSSGVVTGTGTINGGPSYTSGAFLQFVAIRGGTGPGAGFPYGIMSTMDTGGAQPIPTSGSLWLSGGYSVTRGLDWGAQAFSDAAVALGQTNIKMVTGNGYGRITSKYGVTGTDDGLFLSANYNVGTGTIDSSSLGTAEIELRGSNPGEGRVILKAGATNIAPTTRLTVTASATGFNGAAPVTPPSLGAAATDLASVITLANNIRSALIANGLATA